MSGWSLLLYKKLEIESLKRVKAGFRTDLELKQLREEVSKLKTQLSPKKNAIADQAPLTASARNLPLYPPENNAMIGGDRHPLAQSKLRETPDPNWSVNPMTHQFR